MNEPLYISMLGIYANRVDGAENLLRPGEYYIANGQIVMKCPICRFDNLAPTNVKYKTSNWLQRLFGKKVLTMSDLRCWHCQYGIRIVNNNIMTTTHEIHA